MRLDQYLTTNYDIQSRNKAAELIKAGKIEVNKKIVKKSSFDVDETSHIQILEDDFFVSRAAYKLKYFLEEIKSIKSFSITGKNTLDIGSSTGGFTQILLLNDAKKVTCVDVGSNQLHEKIKNESRISFFENTDIRDFKSEEIFEVVTCDVSFISILYIIEDINRLSSKDIIILFKPQFEVGTNVKRDKKGVVKDKKAIAKAREKFIAYTEQLNWKLKHSAMSKLQGKDGNEEELFYFSK